DGGGGLPLFTHEGEGFAYHQALHLVLVDELDDARHGVGLAPVNDLEGLCGEAQRVAERNPHPHRAYVEAQDADHQSTEARRLPALAVPLAELFVLTLAFALSSLVSRASSSAKRSRS